MGQNQIGQRNQNVLKAPEKSDQGFEACTILGTIAIHQSIENYFSFLIFHFLFDENKSMTK